MHSSGKARVQLVFPNKEVIKALGLDELVDCLIGNDAIHRLDQGKAAKALVVTVKYNHILAGRGIKLEPSDQMAAAAACSPQKTQMAVMEQIEHSHGEANAARRCSRRFMRHPHTPATATVMKTKMPPNWFPYEHEHHCRRVRCDRLALQHQSQSGRYSWPSSSRWIRALPPTTACPTTTGS